MANDCFNELTMIGIKRDIDNLELIFGQKNPLDYLMPFPTELFDMVEDSEKDEPDSGLPKWRIWVEYNWGTKYFLLEGTERKEKNNLEVKFITAWRPPKEMLYLLGRMFCDVKFILEFREPLMEFKGRLVVDKGEIVENKTEEWNWQEEQPIGSEQQQEARNEDFLPDGAD